MTRAARRLGRLAWRPRTPREKRFSLGYFDERYLSHFDCAVVRRAGAIVAFANIWRAGRTPSFPST